MTVTDRQGGIALAEIRRRGRVRTALALTGPAFVASVAYADPGNFATNFAAGGSYGYQLVWVVVMANIMAILVSIWPPKWAYQPGGIWPNCAVTTTPDASTSCCGSKPRSSPWQPTCRSSSAQQWD